MKVEFNFEDLKEFMSDVKTVEEWNDKRQQAKEVFDTKVINELDSSGYIKQVLRKNKEV